MAILRIRDADGNVVEITALRGRTPVKGVDYFTPSEIETFINAIRASHYTKEEIDQLANDLVIPIYDLLSDAASKLYVEEEINKRIGDIEGALDVIIALQNGYIGGGA